MEKAAYSSEEPRIKHRGMVMGHHAIMVFLKAFRKWIEEGKKFQVALDYDPERIMLIQFRLPDEAASAVMEKLNPNHGE